LRGDLLTRYQAFAIARNWGFLNVNEIRRLENLNSIGEDGDIYLQPLNMQPAGDVPQPVPQPGRANGGDRAAGPPIILPPGQRVPRLNGVDHE